MSNITKKMKESKKEIHTGIRLPVKLVEKIDKDVESSLDSNRSIVIRRILNEFYSKRDQK